MASDKSGEKPEKGTDEPVIRPFADVLRELSRGSSHDELSEALHDLIDRVRDTRKVGTLVYSIKVGPLKGTEDALVVVDQIKMKLPEHDRENSIFYADKHGNLSRNDPNQPMFESLVEVGTDVGVSEIVDTSTGETTKRTRKARA